MLPDFEPPKTPKGFKFVGIRIPKIGDYLIDFYGKPYLVIKESLQYYVENQWIFKKMTKRLVKVG